MISFITGASGFIGSHLTDAVAGKVADGKKDDTVCLSRDMLPRPWTRHALRNAIIVRGSLNEPGLLERIMSDYDVEKAYHCGAQAIVSKAQRNPAEAFSSTVQGTVSFLEACRLQDVKLAVVVITDKIFGNRINAKADDPYIPTGIYETSKICQDAICAGYSETYGMEIARVRACNQYGLDYNRRIVPNTVRNCLNGISPVIYLNDEARRQYMYIDDLVSAMRGISKGGAYNFGTADFLTQEEAVMKILSNFPGVRPAYVKKDAGAPKELCENSLESSVPGWKPQYSFDDGIRLTISRYRFFGW